MWHHSSLVFSLFSTESNPLVPTKYQNQLFFIYLYRFPNSLKMAWDKLEYLKIK